jgi:hypothetical protein
MADSKTSGLTEGTVVDPANDWFVYVDTSDTTQDLLTGSTKKLRPSNVPISTAMQTALNAKQNTLVSATNIKTINTQSILGSGDITIGGSAAWGGITGTLSTQTDLQTALNAKQSTLTTGTISQYFRGDLSLATLDKTAVGLGNVANATTTISTSAPSGGADGDIWFQYTP